jgi:hypothetical protein
VRYDGAVLGVIIVYLGLIAGSVGAVSCLKPPSWLGIRNRRQAALLMGSGFVLVLVGWFLPASEMRVVAPRTQLDQFVPVYQFNEFHSIRVAAPRAKVYAAIKAVTADEISLFRTLTWMRRFGQSGAEGILNAPPHEPILDVATTTSFLLLAEKPNHEIVLGTAVIIPRGWRPSGRPTPEGFKALHEPGFAVAAMNFLVEDAGPGAALVTTETRIYATDASARRRFAVYWRTIYPGSSLLRYTWLRAIKRRAESRS